MYVVASRMPNATVAAQTRNAGQVTRSTAATSPRPEQLAKRQLAFEQPDVEKQQRREHRRRFLAEHAQHGGDEIEVVAPGRAAANEQQQRDHDAERREDFRARDDVVDRLGVRGMQRVPRRRQQRQPAVPLVRMRAIHQLPVERQQQHALHQEQREVGHVKHERVETAAQPVVERERRGHQRPVALVGRQRAERRRAGEEQRDVTEAADEDVVLDGVDVVEMEVVVEVRRVGAGRQEDRGGARDPPPGHFTSVAPASPATAPSVVCAAFRPSRKSLSV